MKTIQDFIKLGMDREVPSVWPTPERGIILNLGPGNGNKKVPDSVAVGRPEWEAPARIPYGDGSVAEIHAYHFFEHLTGADAIRVLRDCQRVMMIGGVLNIVTPYYTSQMQYQDLDHKSFWNERTWNTLLSNQYWDDNETRWKLEVHMCFMFALVERNLALFTQLVKR